MQFLLNISSGLAFLILCIITVSISITGLHFVRKKFSPEALKENHEVAAIIFNAFGLLYAVVVAFVVFVTWNGYDEARKNLQMEANETVDIFYSTKGFPDSAGNVIRQGLIDYAKSVRDDELKKMAENDMSTYSTGAMRKLLNFFNTMNEKTASNRELYGESLKRVNTLAEYRRLRIFAGDDTVPHVIWIVLLAGAIITISYTYFFGMKNVRAQYMATAALTVTITLILFLIYILDHPFAGTNKVSDAPLRQVIEIMEKGI